MKEKVLKWWNDWLNGAVSEYNLTRTKVLKIIIAVILIVFAFFLIGRCSTAKASDKPVPPKTIIITQDSCDDSCQRKKVFKGIAIGAIGVGGVWYFNQKGSEKKPIEVGIKLRDP